MLTVQSCQAYHVKDYYHVEWHVLIYVLHVGDLSDQVVAEAQGLAGGPPAADRKWSPQRPYVSPFQAAQRGPSHSIGSAGSAMSTGMSLVMEQALPGRAAPPLEKIPARSSSSDSHVSQSGPQDIQPEVLLRGGSYVRPNRVFSGDSVAPMESVPEGKSLADGIGIGAGREKLWQAPVLGAASGAAPRSGPPGLSPLRSSSVQGGAQVDPNAPLMLSQPSRSFGSGFPIGQLMADHPQV